MFEAFSQVPCELLKLVNSVLSRISVILIIDDINDGLSERVG